MHNNHDFEIRLRDFAQGAQDADLERHLGTCLDCRDTIFSLRQLARLQRTAGGPLADPPRQVLNRASGLLARVRPDLVARPQSLAARVREQLGQVTATLLLDTGLTPQVAGLRGGDRRTRQFAFVSDVADLDLEVSRFSGGFSVAGQLGMDAVPANLHIRFVPAGQDPLAEESSGMLETAISQQGYFTLMITAGDWTAAVEIEDAVVLFPGVRL